MAEIIEVPFSFRSKLIDALLDIRLTLSVKKISNKFILKSELKTILDNAKQEAQDLKVSNAIDEVFGEYFKNNSKPVNKEDGALLSIDQMQDLIDKETGYKDTGDQKGTAFVKTDGHYNSSTDTAKPAA